jgi:hypothetical protein
VAEASEEDRMGHEKDPFDCFPLLVERIREELGARIAFGDDPHTEDGQQVLSELVADAILDVFVVRRREGQDQTGAQAR